MAEPKFNSGKSVLVDYAGIVSLRGKVSAVIGGSDGKPIYEVELTQGCRRHGFKEGEVLEGLPEKDLKAYS